MQKVQQCSQLATMNRQVSVASFLLLVLSFLYKNNTRLKYCHPFAVSAFVIPEPSRPFRTTSRSTGSTGRYGTSTTSKDDPWRWNDKDLLHRKYRVDRVPAYTEIDYIIIGSGIGGVIGCP